MSGDRSLLLVEHLEKLRRRLNVCLASIFVFALLSYFQAEKILALIFILAAVKMSPIPSLKYF